MTQHRLTPYDTGDRCEPKPWQPDVTSVAAAVRSGETEDIGKVDFDDDEGHTVATVFVSRDEDGIYALHVIPFVDDSELTVQWHSEPVV